MIVSRMKDPVAAIVAAYFVVWITGFCLQIVARRQLRALYPEIAARIAPGFLRNSIASSLAWLRFIIRREYRSFDHPSFVRLCEAYLVTLAVFAVIFAVTVAAFLHLSGSRS